MNHSCADWRADLEASRDLTDLEKQNYGFLLAWFETWRLRQGMGPERESWQLEQRGTSEGDSVGVHDGWIHREGAKAAEGRKGR